jgi:hypothetical protein
MGARVTVVVSFPDGSLAPGVSLLADNRNAWNPRQRYWNGRTDSSGQFIWGNLDTGTAGDLFDFNASLVDETEVKWSGSATDRIAGPASVRVVLQPEFAGKLTLPTSVIENLSHSPEGRRVGEALVELQSAISSGLVDATLTLSTWILEGMIRSKLKVQKVWDDAWDSLTYGQLVSQKRVRDAIPEASRDRALAIADLRKPSAHFKAGKAVPADAQVAVTLVQELAITWFGQG